MMQSKMRQKFEKPRPAGGFSLVELLVVLLILAILISIAAAKLISTLPERQLAAAGERFGNNISYARTTAEASGNVVFIGFRFEPDSTQVGGYMDEATGNLIDSPTKFNEKYLNPGNPGVRRTAKEYYIVEERPRWKDADGDPATSGDVAPYTYLDWANDYDLWKSNPYHPVLNLRGYYYPVEPMFPYSIEDTVAAGVIPDPKLGPDPSEGGDTPFTFNRMAAPLVVYPQDMRMGGDGTTFEQRHHAVRGPKYGSRWEDDAKNYQLKLFCIADQGAILAMDENDSDPDVDFVPGVDSNGNPITLRTYDPTPGGMNGGNPGSRGDHPRLLEQVTD
ncbi:prepilin-type N-terminal cleavage/methylation domain-containing protein, partial [bacterium]|nr:prepilin-type N-terminal cleavage/methylation domain-containing protein [bacterium]